MQKPVDTTQARPPIPQHVVERLEAEWRQMRETLPATPANGGAAA